MKARSALLFLFMIAVPAAALFSHRIPADLRRLVRERSVQAAGALAGLVVGSPVEDKPVAASRQAPAVVESAPPRDSSPPPSAAVAAPSNQMASVSTAPAGPPALDARLARLGAVAFDCRPVAGGHQATCSVPLDASGQLVRVFHATGIDGAQATAALIADVTAWRERTEPSRSAAVRGPEPIRRF